MLSNVVSLTGLPERTSNNSTMEACDANSSHFETDDEGRNVTLSGVINRVLLPVVCAFGIVGNMLNLAILTRRKLKKSFRTLEQAANLCLIYLAVSDLLFCIFAGLTTFLPADNIYNERGFLLAYAVCSVGIINIFIMTSTMLTVAMSLERYLAICFPLRQDIYLTTCRIKFVIGFSFIFSALFNIPVFWRIEAVTICANESHHVFHTVNETVHNLSSLVANVGENMNFRILIDQDIMGADSGSTQTLADAVFNASWSLHPNIPQQNKLVSVSSSSVFSTRHLLLDALSSLSQPSLSPPPASTFSLTKTNSHHTYMKKKHSIRIVPLAGSHAWDITYRVLWAVFGNFIPLVLLLYFNICLCQKIYRSYKQRRQLGRQVRTRSSSHVLTITLVAIVVLFLILVAPSEVTLQISHITSSQDSPLYMDIEAVLNLMQSINFSVNFILYCIISPYFRKTLKYMMMCGCYNIYQVSRSSKKDFDTSLL